jgi:hypothetical protein
MVGSECAVSGKDVHNEFVAEVYLVGILGVKRLLDQCLDGNACRAAGTRPAVGLERVIDVVLVADVDELTPQRQLLQPQRDHRLRQGPDWVPGLGSLMCVAVGLGRAGHHGDVPLGGGDLALARVADHRRQRLDRDGSPAIG